MAAAAAAVFVLRFLAAAAALLRAGEERGLLLRVEQLVHLPRARRERQLLGLRVQLLQHAVHPGEVHPLVVVGVDVEADDLEGAVAGRRHHDRVAGGDDEHRAARQPRTDRLVPLADLFFLFLLLPLLLLLLLLFLLTPLALAALAPALLALAAAAAARQVRAHDLGLPLAVQDVGDLDRPGVVERRVHGSLHATQTKSYTNRSNVHTVTRRHGAWTTKQTHRGDVDDGDADVVLGEVVEAAGVGLVEAAVAVGEPGPLLQDVEGAARRLAERRQRPVRAVAALRRVAPQLPHLLLRRADDHPLVLLPQQLLQLLLRNLNIAPHNSYVDINLISY